MEILLLLVAQLAFCASSIELPANTFEKDVWLHTGPALVADMPSVVSAPRRLRRSRTQRWQSAPRQETAQYTQALPVRPLGSFVTRLDETGSQTTWSPLLKKGAVLLGSLAFLAGVAETFCFTKYRCYANMMTGNTVMAGTALAAMQWSKLALFATMIVHYVAGVALFRLLDNRLGFRRVAATAPLILLIHCLMDALSCRFDSHWPLPVLALGCGLVNAFSSSSPGVVTNMLTGHWHTLAGFLADSLSGRATDPSKNDIARRSLGVVIAFVMGVVGGQVLLHHGCCPRFWWLGVAYACIFILHDAPRVWRSLDTMPNKILVAKAVRN
mmetsp:Transcript_33589/g.62950  ORF Transcript_33589/g.62950 Transcript_33589/m.62950 type:complete len:327 (-) Transcript_33589:535-1515(-)